MKKLSFLTSCFALAISLWLSTPVFATNGDNMIGIGPISRSMGGVGVANPLDVTSAVFSNPAALRCTNAHFDFAGTLFMPKVDAEIDRTSGITRAESDKKSYAIPAIGFAMPLESTQNKLFIGMAAYGVSGLGVDYRGTDLDNTQGFDFGGGNVAPLMAGEFTSLQIMKFAFAAGYKLSEQFSLGLSTQIDYSSLDFRDGSSFNYAVGVQPGMLYQPIPNMGLGLTYVTPQNVKHENITDFDGDGALDNLELEIPQQLTFGLSYHFVDLGLLIELNGKWINWADAKGYKDFDWENQMVWSVGAQFQPTEQLYLRAGFNISNNPVKENNNWDGSFNNPNSIRTVQGSVFPSYYYETFRLIGFPAIVKSHLTLGAGYAFSKQVTVNVSYLMAFEEDMSETGTDPFGQPISLKSTLSETSFSFGVSYCFK